MPNEHFIIQPLVHSYVQSRACLIIALFYLLVRGVINWSFGICGLNKLFES